jgi:serum/glucocorticoid-regulated kinase 2
LQKKITPPFKPKIKSDIDCSFFDEEFTKQPISESIIASKSLFESLNESEQNDFQGFTFSGSEQELNKIRMSVSLSVNTPNENKNE